MSLKKAKSAPAPVKPTEAPVKPTEAPAPTSMNWAKLSGTAKGPMTDPDTAVRYSYTPVPLAGEVKEGSWFDCQHKAGLLVIVQGPA